MRKELFGVFGSREDFDRFRDRQSFDAVVEGAGATVGIRDPAISVPGRSAVHADETGACALFGEVVPPAGGPSNPARWLLEEYTERGHDALGALNGSYLAFLDTGGMSIVATDPIRSWECYYADVDSARAFSTDVTAIQGLFTDLDVDRAAALEMLHLGTVLGEATLFESIRRIPFDSYLTEAGVEPLNRFAYDPREFDYVDELANRLLRAIRRRSHYPGRKGLLLSGGSDSRVFLSQLPDLDATYTIGSPESREVRVARNLARQYGVAHTTLEPGVRYLYPTDEKILYGQGIKEALHIHHAGYDDEIDADVMYHGLLFDTLFKGYFLERDGMSVFGSELPSNALVSDPKPIESLLDTLGYLPEGSRRLADAADDLFPDFDLDLEAASPRAFLRDSLRAELETCRDRTESPHNAMDLLMIKNQPVLPFRIHLADNYLESSVALDADLLRWHLRAPPQQRNSTTFRRALTRIDGDIFRYQPPSKPHLSDRLNQIERFVRRKVPFFEEFEPAWPGRREVYNEYRLGESLFPDHDDVRDLPPRHQLRVNDVRWWLS